MAARGSAQQAPADPHHMITGPGRVESSGDPLTELLKSMDPDVMGRFCDPVTVQDALKTSLRVTDWLPRRTDKDQYNGLRPLTLLQDRAAQINY